MFIVLYSGRATSLGARAMSAKFKAFSFPVIKSCSGIPFFCYSVFSSIPNKSEFYELQVVQIVGQKVNHAQCYD